MAIACLMFLLPESPYWLIEQSKHEEAKKSLKFFRKTPIEREFADIKAKRDMRKEDENQSLGMIRKLASYSFIRPFGVIGGLRQALFLCSPFLSKM